MSKSASPFRDHFSEKSDKYQKFRPHYPNELFAYLASKSKQRQTAWDCATGNGQSAISLADHFDSVIGTDASEQQIRNATQKSGISYHVATAEKSKIESGSIDLITVAQAFHWFNFDEFFLEADRVLKTNGLVAIWTYNLLSIHPDIDSIINHLYGTTLDEFWFKERTMVEEGYKNVVHPLQSTYCEIEVPEFKMSTKWSLPQLTGYLNTWSAVKKYQKQNGTDPVSQIQEALLGLWCQPEELRDMTWPLGIRLWRKQEERIPLQRRGF